MSLNDIILIDNSMQCSADLPSDWHNQALTNRLLWNKVDKSWAENFSRETSLTTPDKFLIGSNNVYDTIIAVFCAELANMSTSEECAHTQDVHEAIMSVFLVNDATRSKSFDCNHTCQRHHTPLIKCAFYSFAIQKNYIKKWFLTYSRLQIPHAIPWHPHFESIALDRLSNQTFQTAFLKITAAIKFPVVTFLDSAVDTARQFNNLTGLINTHLENFFVIADHGEELAIHLLLRAMSYATDGRIIQRVFGLIDTSTNFANTVGVKSYAKLLNNNYTHNRYSYMASFLTTELFNNFMFTAGHSASRDNIRLLRTAEPSYNTQTWAYWFSFRHAASQRQVLATVCIGLALLDLPVLQIVQVFEMLIPDRIFALPEVDAWAIATHCKNSAKNLVSKAIEK